MSGSDDETGEVGRKAVRRRLIEPLVAEGMRRPRGVSPEEHDAFIERIVAKLAYMEPALLDRFRGLVREQATGGARDRWPSEITILNLAYAVQPPPDASDDILWSWLHSRKGVEMRQAGMLMAVRAFIKGNRRPPKNRENADDRFYREVVLPELQREIDRDIEALRRAVAMGEARPSEVERLRAHDEVLAGLEAIVEAGVRWRREQAEAEGQAA